MTTIRRITAVTGWGSLVATSSWLWYTRQSHLQPLDHNDYLFQSTFMARLNPDNHPAMSDVCIRELPLSKIKPELLTEDGKLVEQFCAKTFGGIGICNLLENGTKDPTDKRVILGFEAQRALLKRSNYNTKTAHNLWTQPELASSIYPVGTEMVDHFEIISKTTDSIIVRCGGSPLDKNVRASDGLFELKADVDEDEKIARFEMKSVFFSGATKSAEHMVPGHIVWGHRLYTKLLMETAVRGLGV